MARKRRSDRNHVIYQLTNTKTGEIYIGMTYARGRAFVKSAKSRFQGHCYFAFDAKKETTLYRNMRAHGVKVFKVSVLEIVRGKKECHKRETQLIRDRQPDLNMVSR